MDARLGRRFLSFEERITEERVSKVSLVGRPPRQTRVVDEAAGLSETTIHPARPVSFAVVPRRGGGPGVTEGLYFWAAGWAVECSVREAIRLWLPVLVPPDASPYWDLAPEIRCIHPRLLSAIYATNLRPARLANIEQT